MMAYFFFILNKAPRGEHQQIADTLTKYYDAKKETFYT
jgi:hypothetical protein